MFEYTKTTTQEKQKMKVKLTLEVFNDNGIVVAETVQTNEMRGLKECIAVQQVLAKSICEAYVEIGNAKLKTG